MEKKEPPAMVRVTLHRPQASGGRLGFHKTVAAVDEEKKTAYAFIGNFIPNGREIDLPEGAIIVRKTPAGSARNEEFLWSWATVPPDGVSWQWSEPVSGRSFLTFRDAVKTALARANAGNGSRDYRDAWAIRPAETVPNPEAAPPKSAAVRNGPQFFAALANAGNGVSFDPAAGRFRADPAGNGDAAGAARDANRFLDALEARCPATLAGHITWNGQGLAVQASRKAMFQAIYGLDEELLKKAVRNREGPKRRPADAGLREAIERTIQESAAAIEKYRNETWQAAERNLYGLDLKLYPHPLNDTRIIYI